MRAHRPSQSPASSHRTCPRVCVLLAATGWCGGPQAQALLDQPLEALIDVQLTTLGRRVQPEQEMAIATSVFAGDDLRRGGARTLLEALAWIPGVSVERLQSNFWGVTVRGDGSSLVAHNTLIMRDGREQNTPGGPPWVFLNMPIDQVQRIEVQRGAGNTLWGANAANCVINVVTRTPDKGGAGGVDADSHGRAAANVQWGTRTETGWRTSFWASGQHAPGSVSFAGRSDWDNQDDRAAGAAALLAVEGGAEVSLDINAYNGVGGTIGTAARAPARQQLRIAQREFGSHLSVPQDDAGQIEFAMYLQDIRMTTTGGVDRRQRTEEVSVQDFWRLGSHELLAGASVHTDSISSLAPTPGATAVPTEQQRLQVYAQDEWRFADNRGSVLVGAQAQRLFTNAFIDNLYAGTLRLRWSATPELSLWASLSRSGTLANGTEALRIPSVEAGLRWQASREFQANAAVFEQRFGSYRVPTTVPPVPNTPLLDTKLRVRGLEADVRWQPTPQWNLESAIALQRAHFDIDGPGRSILATEAGYFGAAPRNTFKSRLLYQADDRRSFEIALRARPALDIGFSPGRGIVDLAYRHQLSKGVEFGTALKQANHDELVEFTRPNIPFSSIERRALGLWLSWGV